MLLYLYMPLPPPQNSLCDSTGYVSQASSPTLDNASPLPHPAGQISLALNIPDPSPGEEGNRLTISVLVCLYTCMTWCHTCVSWRHTCVTWCHTCVSWCHTCVTCYHTCATWCYTSVTWCHTVWIGVIHVWLGVVQCDLVSYTYVLAPFMGDSVSWDAICRLVSYPK